jgi:hypothetical protein
LIDAERLSEMNAQVPYYLSVQKCMAALGFVYTPPAPRQIAIQRDIFSVTALRADVSQWPKHGYGMSNAMLALRAQARADMGSADASAAYSSALFGVLDPATGDQSNGCLVSAKKGLAPYLKAKEIGLALRDVEQEIAKNLDASPEGLGWRTCMNERGVVVHSVRSPIDLVSARLEELAVPDDIDLSSPDNPRFPGQPELLSKFEEILEYERSIAEADAKCGVALRAAGQKLLNGPEGLRLAAVLGS